MTVVTLTGLLICRDETEAAAVERHLPEHLRRTRAEPGCLAFEVTRRPGTRTWDVAERFVDARAFAAHQQRVAESTWGAATAGIERRYAIE
ncbi:putative quinol monooxygenase [Schumannella soli]|uniref:Antibiotic biosynthesis monooxygenase n=1 Tax=Schumannella soli TaxID=2590779 RepID=A0A506Y2J4_9MICO|nr:antibiotic biosynthesis monooxygenase [Schumannella soli]TPW76202.1 antibiotic biosynthesis monooxygenase [Schumannella soli]